MLQLCHDSLRAVAAQLSLQACRGSGDAAARQLPVMGAGTEMCLAVLTVRRRSPFWGGPVLCTTVLYGTLIL